MTAPDPEIVREIAQQVADIALHDAVHVDQWISAVVGNRLGNECSQVKVKYHTAVARRMAVVKPSWPDEQQPAVLTTDPGRDVVVEAAVRDLGKLADAWLGWFDSGQDGEPPAMPERRIEIADHLGRVRIVLTELKRLTDRVAHLNSARDSAVRAWKQEHDGADELQRERDALAARVAELTAEREADTRAVARCQQAKAGPDAVPAMLALDARFADRIEALAGDEMDGGAA